MRSEAQKGAEKKYKQSEKGKATAKRYIESDKGKIKEARYRQSEKSKARLKRFRQSEKGKIMHARFRQTEKGKIINARICAKRKRNLGYNVINNQFPSSEGHHINKDNVLFIPEELHQLNRHRLSDPESMKVINTLAFEWLVTQEML